MSRKALVGLAATLSLTAGAALAQTAIQPRDPNMPAPQNTIPEKIEEPGETGSTGTLSDRLERSEGVITPPATGGNDMVVPAPVPNPGTTPVIPPPGSPGGTQTLQPK